MIKIYTTSSCHYCKVAKEYFKKNNLSYEEIDVTKNRKEAQKILDKTGFLGVPIIEINGEYMMGFNKSKIDKLCNVISR